jgi:hypothetical protein
MDPTDPGSVPDPQSARSADFWSECPETRLLVSALFVMVAVLFELLLLCNNAIFFLK